MSYLRYMCLFGSSLHSVVGEPMSYLRYMCLFGSSLPSVDCRRAHVICVCLVRLYLQLIVGLRYMCLFGSFYLQLIVGEPMSYSSLPSVDCRRAHVLFTLYVFVWFVFTFS